MSDWHDINEPGFFRKPDHEPEDRENVGINPDDDSQVTPQEPEIRFMTARFLPHPIHGYRINKPALVRGTVEFLKETKRVKITVETDAATDGTSFETLGNVVEATVAADGTFECEVPLYIPRSYSNDGTDIHSSPIRYRSTLTHSLHEKPLDAFLDLPADSTAPLLKQGMFDDKGIEYYPNRLHNQKKGYVENDPVYRVQDMLITMGFLSQKKPDGDFGPKTEKAVRDFQQAAMGTRRLHKTPFKLVSDDRKANTFPGPVDGVVGSDTRNELDYWRRSDWAKPVLELYHGDYDDEGAGNGKGPYDGEDYHKGSVVRDVQTWLVDRGFDETGKPDGWYHDKTKEAVIEFKTCASETTRVVNNETVEVDVTFTGAINGVWDETAQQEQQVWDDNTYHRPPLSDTELIFYAPGRDEYFTIEETAVQPLLDEAAELDALSVDIQAFRTSCQNTKLTGEHTKRAEELEHKVAQHFNGLDQDPAKAIIELFALKTHQKWGDMKRRLYIRPYKIRDKTISGHWRKSSSASLKKALQKWYAAHKSDMVQTKATALLWQTDQLDTQWPWEWKTGKVKGSTDTAVGEFSGSAEAQFFRFVAGAKAGAEFDFSNGPKLNLGVDAGISYSLAEATIKGSWSLPDADGVDLFTFLYLSDNARKAIRPGRECRFRLTTKAEGKAFVGASITASVALPCIDLSRNDEVESGRNEKISGGAGLSGFLGGSLQGKIASGAEWRDQAGGTFDFLATAGVVASGSIGAGGEAKFEITCENGRIRFQAGAMAVIGIGGKAGCSFELSVDEGIELLAHLFQCVDFHRVNSVSLAAFEVFLNVSFAQFVVVGRVTESLINRIQQFGRWLNQTSTNPREISETKQAIRRNITDRGKLQKSPPESLGQLLQTIVEKPEEEDFDAIITILQSAENRNDNAHKLKWIIRSLSEPGLSRREGLTDTMKGGALRDGVEELLGFGEGLDGFRNYNRDLKTLLKRNGLFHENQ